MHDSNKQRLHSTDLTNIALVDLIATVRAYPTDQKADGEVRRIISSIKGKMLETLRTTYSTDIKENLSNAKKASEKAKEYVRVLIELRDNHPGIYQEITNGVFNEVFKMSKDKYNDYIGVLKKSLGQLSAKDLREIIDEEDCREINITKEELWRITGPIDCTREITNGKHVSTVDILEEEKYEKGDYTIPEGCLEIYFWGMPSSGKTCCLAATLSKTTTEENAGSFNMGGNGTRYFSKLRGIMKKNGISILPERTKLDPLAYAPLKIYDGKKDRQLCIIDLPGEIFNYYADEHAGLHGDDDAPLIYKVTLSMLKNNRNRKLHFFVIPYSENDNSENDNRNLELLDNCVSYLNKNKIIEESTNGVYIIVTKTDRMNNPTEENVKDYIRSNYGSFWVELNNICKREGINDGNKTDPVTIIPFSIGTLLTTESCIFVPSSGTDKIIDIFKRKAKVIHEPRKCLLGKVMNVLQKF